MFVLTVDQRGSRRGSDLVPALLRDLRDIPTEAGFERSVGDEVQGVLASAADVVDVAMRVLRTGQWYVGIGVGPVELPLASEARQGRGAAFIAARNAVDRAKKTGERVPLAVVAASQGPGGRAAPNSAAPATLNSPAAAPKVAAAAEAVLVLIGRLVMDRSEAEWRVLDFLQPGVRGQQAGVASVLKISPQAVSKAVLRSGWQEELAGREAAELLLKSADSLAQ
ncbi:MAG: MarR family transcriptional regulator [Acidobacteria bacterium]|nr:MarR family transcriptional regulator [Acidobacteriota bacterium]